MRICTLPAKRQPRAIRGVYLWVPDPETRAHLRNSLLSHGS